jgi:SAM-dependent methyltransferase
MPRDIDALTSSALKDVRDRWWSPAFTEFLRDNLQPRPGARLLDVGCGIGTAELALAPLSAHGIEIIGADLAMTRVAEARATAVVQGAAARFVNADATALPFKDGSVDATFCVGVLQHPRPPVDALAEFARVRSGGRVIAWSPTTGRVRFSALGAGLQASRWRRSSGAGRPPLGRRHRCRHRSHVPG